MSDVRCPVCKLKMKLIEKLVGDGLCHCCGHRSAAQLREEIGRQRADIERMQAIAKAAWEVRREEKDYTPAPDLTLRAMYRKRLYQLLDEWQAAEAARKR